MKGIEWLHTTKCQHTMHIHDTCYIITQHPESDKRQCIRNQSGLLPNCMGCMLNTGTLKLGCGTSNHAVAFELMHDCIEHTDY